MIPRRLFSLAALLVLALGVSAVNASAQVIASTGQSFGFDYKDADLTAAPVVRFEMQIDTNTFVSVGIPTDTLPITAGKTYKVSIPALVLGTHAVTFRACSVDVCGAIGNIVSFKFVLVPAEVFNVRIVGVTGGLF